MPVQGMTPEEIAKATAAVVAAGGKSTDRANRLPGETATEANARITAAYKAQPKPELTVQGKAAGATIQFVRTAGGGVGTYKEVFPIGATIPVNRTVSNGNVYDPQGNPISGDSVVLNTPTDTSGKPTTNIDVLKAALRSLGFTSAILDSSTSFLNSLLKEGLDYDNATEVFLNSKEYTLKSGTKISSPFYTEYGYLNEGLVVPKSASEIFNAVEGYKEIVDKYALSKKYLEKDSLKNYVKNNVTVADLAERANIATLKSVNQDPAYVEALQKLGFISTAADLKDFFMDPKIGKEQLELNRNAGAFAAEAIRRAKSGIQFNAERLKSLASTLTEKGFSEEKISALAAEGFENIAEQLNTTTKLSGIYETQRQATMGQIQSELETEQFGGLASERRKRLSEQEIRAFQGSAGTTTGSLRQTNVLGIL